MLSFHCLDLHFDYNLFGKWSVVWTIEKSEGDHQHKMRCVWLLLPPAAAAAVAAKSLQSCPTLCDPRDGSPPGSPVPGILQARTLAWVLPPGYQVIAKEKCVRSAAPQESQATLGLSYRLNCQLLKDSPVVDLLITFHCFLYRVECWKPSPELDHLREPRLRGSGVSLLSFRRS